MKTKVILLLLCILLTAGCTSNQFHKIYSNTDEPVLESTVQEAEKSLEQIQHKTSNYQEQCQVKACSARTSDEVKEALVLCELTVKRPGYIAYTLPVQYLQAKTLLLLKLNQTEEATSLYEEYKQIVQDLNYAPAQETYQKEYFDCMENPEAKECLRTKFCEPDQAR